MMINGTTDKREIWVNLAEVWEYGIVDAIERNADYIDFAIMPHNEFIQECIDLITCYYENEMLGSTINYNNVVIDAARTYDMLKGT